MHVAHTRDQQALRDELRSRPAVRSASERASPVHLLRLGAHHAAEPA